ncbi:unnamed protein product [Lactuca saligna]|uniref:ZF-HD dimerization-type domain-containing protein n=1 Tax=Lactuca saligna TaxID=75948 RepID=A0AA36E4L9_LACSI|nr:unnamed protein product [Lactuca saligna]
MVFHCREPTNDFLATVTRNHFIDFNRPCQTSTSTSTSSTPPSPPPQPTNYAFGGHLLLPLSTAADQTHMTAMPMAIKSSGRKRFRMKFSLDQKENMTIFAKRLGWRMQICDDKLIADFCNEIGIKRGIFKVWMHNNKNNFGKREKNITTIATTVVAAAVIRSNDITHQENGNDDVHLQASNNGSSSSS